MEDKKCRGCHEAAFSIMFLSSGIKCIHLQTISLPKGIQSILSSQCAFKSCSAMYLTKHTQVKRMDWGTPVPMDMGCAKSEAVV